MINYYVKEYVAVCDYLKKLNSKITLDYFIVKKEELIELLNKNKFDSAQHKLKIWKLLRWIDTDQDRLTKRIYEPEAKKYVPYIKIYRQVYITLKELSETNEV